MRSRHAVSSFNINLSKFNVKHLICKYTISVVNRVLLPAIISSDLLPGCLQRWRLWLPFFLTILIASGCIIHVYGVVFAASGQSVKLKQSERRVKNNLKITTEYQLEKGREIQ
jgi:hypothetical protein